MYANHPAAMFGVCVCVCVCVRVHIKVSTYADLHA